MIMEYVSAKMDNGQEKNVKHIVSEYKKYFIKSGKVESKIYNHIIS